MAVASITTRSNVHSLSYSRPTLKHTACTKGCNTCDAHYPASTTYIIKCLRRDPQSFSEWLCDVTNDDTASRGRWTSPSAWRWCGWLVGWLAGCCVIGAGLRSLAGVLTMLWWRAWRGEAAATSSFFSSSFFFFFFSCYFSPPFISSRFLSLSYLSLSSLGLRLILTRLIFCLMYMCLSSLTCG